MKRTTDIITNLCNEIQNSDLVDQLDSSIDADPNKNYEIVNKIIQSAKEKHMPYVLKKYHKHKHKKSYWISTGIMKSIKTRDKLYRTLKKMSQNSENYATVKYNLSIYNKILKKTIRNAKKSHYEFIFEKYKNDNKKTWNLINNILNKSKG